MRQLADRDGAVVVAAYREVYSGVTADRPEFKDVLARAAIGEVQAIYVAAFDRLTRSSSPSEIEELRRALIRLRVDLISPAQRWEFSDPGADTPESELTFHMLGAVAGYDKRKITHRLTAGKTAKAKAGHWVGGPTPYGYCAVFAPDGTRSFVVDEERAAVVRRAFDLYLQGRGYVAIARDLNGAGHLAPRGGRWSQAGVKVILTNGLYGGLAEHHKLTGARKAGELHTVPSLDFPALLPVETVYAVRAAMARRRQRPRVDVPEQHPLSGILRCGSCGAGMVWENRRNYAGGKRRVYHYYTCRSRVDPSRACPLILSYSAKTAHALVLDALRRALVDMRLGTAAPPPTSASEAVARTIIEHRGRVQQLDQEEVRLTRELAQGALVGRTDIYLRAVDAIAAERASLVAALAGLERGAVTTASSAEARAALVGVADWSATLEPDDPELRGLFALAVASVTLRNLGRQPGDRRRAALEVAALTLSTGEVWPFRRDTV